MLRKKMGVKIKTAAEKDRFIEKLTKMSRHELDEFLINKRVKQVHGLKFYTTKNLSYLIKLVQ